MIDFEEEKCDLYVRKENISKMLDGDSAIGYIHVAEEEKEKFELISQYAFQPFVRINANSFSVVLIFK